MSFQSELDELIEETARAATDAFVHWVMKDLWTGDSLPNTVREGSFDDGWIVGDFLDGQHITFRSPSTGKVPSPFWATDIPGVSLGDHLHKDLEDKPEEWHQLYLDQLNTSFAKWRDLPEESAIVTATEQILDHAAWRINWQPGLGLQVKPSLDGWLADIEPVNTENYGQAFNAFYSRYGETRDILCNNLRQDLIDLAACGAADAAAINAAKASALSLAESVRDAMLAAHPDGGQSSSSAAWDTIGLIASIVPAKGVVEQVVAGIEAAKGVYENAQGPARTVSGEHPDDVMADFWAAEGEFLADFNAGMTEITAAAQTTLDYLRNDELSALPPARLSDAQGEVRMSWLAIENIKSAMLDLADCATDPIPEVTYNQAHFDRDNDLNDPYSTVIMEAKYELFGRLNQLSNDLTDGRADLIEAVRIMRETDTWSEESLQALLGF
ncbi:MAG: hypothetical protein WCS84_15090 [Nocardioides sp.]